MLVDELEFEMSNFLATIFGLRGGSCPPKVSNKK